MWKPEEVLQNYLSNGFARTETIELVFPESDEEEHILELIPDCNILIGWRPTEKLLEAGKSLRLCINPGAGVKHLIDLFRKFPDLILCNGHGNAYFTAQHTIALLLALANRVLMHHDWMKQGRWRTGDKEAASIPLKYRKIGLLGYGAVNQKVHQFLRSFEPEVFMLKKHLAENDDRESVFTIDRLDEFLELVDTLIIAVPHTSETDGIIDRDRLRYLGKEGLLVNVARGGVIREKALYESLKSNEIAGAAIDVWYEYHPEPDDKNKKFPWHYPFEQLDNVILSPHRAASPFDDLKRWDEVIENISRYHKGRGDILNIVDLGREY